VELLAVALKSENFEQAVQQVADALRERLGCSRVCIGMVEAGHARAAGMSGTRAGEHIRGVTRPMEKAMDEAADQQATVCIGAGAPDAGLVSAAHRRLLEEHALVCACSIPMIHNGEVVAAVTCEFTAAPGLDSGSLQFCEQAALLLGPVLALKRGPARAPRRLALGRLTRRGKAIAAGAAVALLALCLLPGSYEVSSPAVVQSDSKQLLVAAVDGYVASASARPGDRVARGDLLARLDDRDLLLEQQQWQARKNQLNTS